MSRSSSERRPNQTDGRPSCNVRRGCCAVASTDLHQALSSAECYLLVNHLMPQFLDTELWPFYDFGFSICMFQRINSSVTMSRTMVYPYTIGAMIKAFPLKYHIDKSWVFKVFHHSSAIRRLDYCSFQSHF